MRLPNALAVLVGVVLFTACERKSISQRQSGEALERVEKLEARVAELEKRAAEPTAPPR